MNKRYAAYNSATNEIIKPSDYEGHAWPTIILNGSVFPAVVMLANSRTGHGSFELMDDAMHPYDYRLSKDVSEQWYAEYEALRKE